MRPVFVPGNRLTLLHSGGEYFPALLGAIDRAQRSIHLETYIFEADRTGRAVAAALSRASRRGVTVRVLVDAFGGGTFPTTLMPGLLADGVQVAIYRPQLFQLTLHQGRLHRLHRKMGVIDERVVFIGGINVIDDRDSPRPELPPRFDFAVRIEGPLAATAQRLVNKLWDSAAEEDPDEDVPAPPAPVADRPPQPNGEDTAAIVIRDNVRHRRDIEHVYLQAIRLAQREIIIANAYFLPGRRFQEALMDAAQRGVSVRVLLEGCAEYPLVYYATQALYGTLLQGGVRIYEYHRSYLHAKVAVIDNEWATVGSSNIDPFSLLLAQEANVVTRSPTFAAQLRKALMDAIEDGAHELKPDDWQHAHLGIRALRTGCYQITRALQGVVGAEQEEPPRESGAAEG